MRHQSPILAAICLATLLGPVESLAQDDEGLYDSRDWAGMRRDLYYLIGWQGVATAIIYNAPFEFSNWSRDEKDQLGFEQWRKNVTDPVWDKDHWGVNYVLHPYWGAGYYIRGRERGFNRKESFWIAALYSSIYEFGIESFLEQPSIQDLIVTPLAGAALGLYFEYVRERIRRKSRPWALTDRLVLGLTDPLGALNRGVNALIGVDNANTSPLLFELRPLRSLAERDVRAGRALGDGSDGFEIHFIYSW